MPMREPRKLAIIGYCAQCPHFVNSRAPSKITGVCSHSEKLAMRGVQFGYGAIPDWCPLPDADQVPEETTP